MDKRELYKALVEEIAKHAAEQVQGAEAEIVGVSDTGFRYHITALLDGRQCQLHLDWSQVEDFVANNELIKELHKQFMEVQLQRQSEGDDA